MEKADRTAHGGANAADGEGDNQTRQLYDAIESRTRIYKAMWFALRRAQSQIEMRLITAPVMTCCSKLDRVEHS